MKIDISKLKEHFYPKPKLTPINEFFDFFEYPKLYPVAIPESENNILKEAIEVKSLGFFNAAVVEHAKLINEGQNEKYANNEKSERQEKELQELRQIYPYKIFSKEKIDQIVKENLFYSNSARVYSGKLPDEMVKLLSVANGVRKDLVYGVVNYMYVGWDPIKHIREIHVENSYFLHFADLHPDQRKSIGVSKDSSDGNWGHGKSQIVHPYYFRLITRFNFTEFNIDSLEEVVILMPVLHNSNLYYLLIND